MPTSIQTVKQQGVSKELSEPIPESESFEGMRGIKSVAGDLGSQRVKDKVIIVTGANSEIGIGRASAHQFARNGARAIYICDFSDSHLEKHKRELNTLYPSTDIHTRQFDAADEASVQKVCQDALDTYGRLDVFFANAGISSGKVFWEESTEGFMNMMRTNALSVFLAAKHASRAMLKTSEQKPYPNGSIIATASVAGLRSNAGPTDYAASKAAVISLMQTCAYQLTGSGIRCNAICPGLIETGMTRVTYDAARKRGSEKKIGQLNPLRRGGQPDEIARAVLFLASDEASYVNAQAWAVDGGLSGGLPFVPGKLASIKQVLDPYNPQHDPEAGDGTWTPNMPPPAAGRHTEPIVFLMGFSCLPGDREYSEAQRATGSATPYWFQERLVYPELRAKPHTKTTTTPEPKAKMPGEHVSDEADKTAQERVKPVKEKAQEKFGVREKGKANSDIKEVKNDRMKTKETKGKDEKMKTEYSKEKHEEIKTNESKERRDKNKKTALNPQSNKPPFKKAKTVSLPRKHVRFAWSTAVTTKRRVPHARRAKRLSKRCLTNRQKPKPKKRNNNKTEETRYLLERFPSPPRSRLPTPSLSDAVSRPAHEQGQGGKQMKRSQLKTKSQTRAQAKHGAKPNGTNIYSRRMLSPHFKKNRRLTLGIQTIEQNDRNPRGIYEREKISLWSVCFGSCFGQRK
ncbi:uncharacterized protein yc1106_01412 [Curvularia clavata]|uniref:NAD(P)-binding protein n=1 Tax=Curvularia clavata TaxID=95742 RepID=A0A9Q9DNM5_CURCL|nr:uncharacterized protein yc1106_01412 [Curvularia clavata]